MQPSALGTLGSSTSCDGDSAWYRRGRQLSSVVAAARAARHAAIAFYDSERAGPAAARAGAVLSLLTRDRLYREESSRSIYKILKHTRPYLH